jgi:hypothetical protein
VNMRGRGRRARRRRGEADEHRRCTFIGSSRVEDAEETDTRTGEWAHPTCARRAARRLTTWATLYITDWSHRP